MDAIYFLRPSRFGQITGLFTIEKFFEGVPEAEYPQFWATLDGKPSEMYVHGTPYCTASLIASSSGAFLDIFDEVSRRYGKPLVKPASLRKKRKIEYLTRVAHILIDLSTERGGLPFNFSFSYASSEALDPTADIEFLRNNPSLQSGWGINSITNTEVIFSYEAELVAGQHANFGGMCHWFRVAQEIDSLHNAKQNSKSWQFLVDKLPLDPKGVRTRIFAKMLDFSFQGRIWVSYSVGRDWKIDLLTDIFVNLCYEVLSGATTPDATLESAVHGLVAANTKKSK